MESQGLTPVAQSTEQFDTQAATVATQQPQSEEAAVETTNEPTPEPLAPQSAKVETEVEKTDSETETPQPELSEQTENQVEGPSEPAEQEPQPSAVTESTDTDGTAAESTTTDGTANPYIGKSQAELTDTMAEMISSRPVQNLRADVEAIKIAFYKASRAATEAKRAEFVEAGGNPDEFVPDENPQELRFKELLNQYREKRDQFTQTTQQEKEEALKTKLSIIDELKELVNSSETVGNTFAAFRALQQRWKEAGIVPQEKIKDLWETYHYHVENFYNYVKINKELRDLDLKKNYEIKLELAEQAEALMLDPSATNAFNKLQKLHDAWREAGPVAPEFKDALWERFKEASTQINKRHQAYFEGIKEEQKQNLALKTELCSKAEGLAEGSFTTRAAWNEASEQIVEIQKVWKTIGFAPKKDNTKIYERFRAACDKFFEAKRSFYNEVKSEIEDNLQAKLDLCMQAEALQQSEDWKAATDTLIALQKQWKEIGATSRKHSEAVWKRFRTACDTFFARKAEHFGSQESKYAENLARKEQILDELRLTVQDKVDVTFDRIKEYQRRWSEIGFVPAKQKDAIQTEYRKVVDQLFDMLRGEERGRHIANFREKVSKIQQGGVRKVNQERERMYNKVRQIESDIQIWENNIGFFAKSKNAEALMREVQNKINKAKEQISTLVEKVKVIDQQDSAPTAAVATAPVPESQPQAPEAVVHPVAEVVEQQESQELTASAEVAQSTPVSEEAPVAEEANDTTTVEEEDKNNATN